MREITGAKIKPIVSVTTHLLELPTAVTIRIAVTMRGSARTASTSRLMPSSTKPRKYPVRSPSAVPSTVPMSVAAGAITRMLRDPARTREKMSRPFVSVPNGKPHSGGRLVGNWLSKIGS